MLGIYSVQYLLISSKTFFLYCTIAPLDIYFVYCKLCYTSLISGPKILKPMVLLVTTRSPLNVAISCIFIDNYHFAFLPV